MDEHEYFAQGERVVWRKPKDVREKRKLRKYKRAYGEGPFTLVGTCYTGRGDHPQMVHIGFVAAFLGQEEHDLPVALSGALFEHTRH